MSVIVWDGKTLAVDKQGTLGELCDTMTKSRKLANGEVIAWTGCQDKGLMIADWYEKGADPDKYPEFQKNENHFVRLVVASKDGVKCYECYPIPIKCEDEFTAYGVGREVAIGALAMGADAVKATEIVSKYCISCGCGIDSYKIR